MNKKIEEITDCLHIESKNCECCMNTEKALRLLKQQRESIKRKIEKMYVEKYMDGKMKLGFWKFKERILKELEL